MNVVEKNTTGTTISLEVSARVDETNKAFEVAQMTLEQTVGYDPLSDASLTDLARERRGIEDIEAFIEPQVAEYLMPFAIDSTSIMPDFTPKIIREEKARRDAPYTFMLEVTPKPEFELSSYEPVTIRIPEFEIPEAEIDRQIAEMAESYAEFDKIEPRPAEEGDSCLITINSTRLGATIPEITMENAIYTVGSNLISEEFDQHLIGMEADETKEFTLAYTAASDLPGEDPSVECVVTLTEVRQRTIPTIDDAWIQSNIPSLKSLEDFKNLLREEFKRSYGGEFEEAKRKEASAELAKRFMGTINDEAFIAMRDTLINNLRIKLQRKGMTLDDHIESCGGQQKFDLDMMMQANEALAQGYALDALFRHRKMTLTDKDIIEACKTIDPQQPELIKKQMEYAGCGFTLRETAARLKASKWLVENATVIVGMEEKAS